MKPGGEYREEGDRDRSVWELREFFLQRVAELAPEVLENQRDGVLPAYKAAFEATQPDPTASKPAPPLGGKTTRERPPEWVRWRFQDGDWEPDPDWPEELVALREQLLAWADDHNLREPWILDAALRTLLFWNYRKSSPTSVVERLEQWMTIYSRASVEHVFKEQDRNVEAALDVVDEWRELESSNELRFLPLRFMDVFETPHFTFEFPGWVPQEKLWRTYEQELREAFEEELDAYEVRRREGPEERDLDSAPEVRAPYHFEWLVLWQVQERSYRQIAHEYDVSTYSTLTGTSSSAVRQAVHDKANKIGLTLRTEY